MSSIKICRFFLFCQNLSIHFSLGLVQNYYRIINKMSLKAKFTGQKMGANRLPHLINFCKHFLQKNVAFELPNLASVISVTFE